MISLRNKSFGKAALAVALFVAFLVPQVASARWKSEFISGSITNGQFLEGKYIDGISEKAAVQWWITNDDKGMNKLSGRLVKGADMQWLGSEYDKDGLKAATNLTPYCGPMSGAEIAFRVGAPLGEASPANLPRFLAITFYYKITNVNGTAFIPTPKPGSFIGNELTNGTYLDIDVIGPTALSVLKGFNFKTIGNYEMDEDKDSLVIAATDSNFECLAWDGNDVVPSTAVAFSEASIESSTQGTVSVVDGKIVYTPAERFLGTAKIEYKAIPTGVDNPAGATGTVTVTVKDVDDRPVITVNPQKPYTLVFNEGMPVNYPGNDTELYFIETENDIEDPSLLEDAVLTLTSAGYDPIVLNVKLVKDGDASGDDTFFMVDFNGVTDIIPFTAVRHPATTVNYTGVLAMTDGGEKAYEVELGGLAVTVNDNDRAPEIAFAGLTAASGYLQKDGDTWQMKADTVLNTPAFNFSDPDEEDEPSLEIAYVLADGSDSATPVMVKGGMTDIKGIVTSNGKTAEAIIPVAVINSEPVLSSETAQIFIQRGGTSFTGTTQFTVTDADGVTDIRILNADGADADSFDVTGGLGGKVELTAYGLQGLTRTFTLTYTVPEDNQGSESDLAGQAILKVTDFAGEVQKILTVTIEFKENPAPAVTFDAASFEIAEVNADGTPATIEFTVTATDSGVVLPSGVSAIDVVAPAGWTVTPKGDAVYGTSTTGVFTATETFTVTTKGYDTIVNDASGKRPRTKDFSIEVSAKDAVTSASGPASTVAVTVTDVNRAPSAPTAVAQTPDSDKAVFDDTLQATFSGSIDADGDEPAYALAWSYSTDGTSFTALAETGDSLDNGDAVRKGNTVKVVAKAYDMPYGDAADKESDGTYEATWTIGNTAPYFSSIGDNTIGDDPALPLTYTITAVEGGDPVSFNLLGVDVDLDKLTYGFDALDEKVGTIALAENANGGMTVTFTPKNGFNTKGVDPDSLPKVGFSLKDSDGANSQNTATLAIQVTEVNDAPSVVDASDYVLPDQLGVERTMEFTVHMGLGEDDQVLTAAVIKSVIDANSILDGEPAIEFQEKSVTLTYKVKSDAPLGKGAVINFGFTDNGTTNGVEDFKEGFGSLAIYIGATPWYPIITFECVDPENHVDGHVVRLFDETGFELPLVIRGDRRSLLPADYYEVGFKGFEENTSVDYEVRVWSMTDGDTGVICGDGDAKKVEIDEYGLPGEATAAAPEATADDEGWVRLPPINVPMSRDYILSVVNGNGETVQTIGPNSFEPNESGMIISEAAGIELQIPVAGEYSLYVQGINPNGEGPNTEVLTIHVPESSDAVLAWTNAPAFMPADGKILTSGTVKMAWPVATHAQEYSLKIFDADGKLIKSEDGISGTTTTVSLDISEEIANYSWYVTAKNGNNTLDSGMHQFSLATTTKDLVITGVFAHRGKIVIITDGLLDESLDVVMDYQFFSIADFAWYNGYGTPVEIVTGEQSGSKHRELKLPDSIYEFTPKVGDYIVITVYVDGKKTSDLVVYQLQEYPFPHGI